jgi:hypothetical protein
MPRDFFREHFLKRYMDLSNDKVQGVRMECASASAWIRPYFEQDVDLSLELIDMVHKLSGDKDHDVSEAAEHAEYMVLQKHTKIKDPDAEDARRVEHQE